VPCSEGRYVQPSSYLTHGLMNLYKLKFGEGQQWNVVAQKVRSTRGGDTLKSVEVIVSDCGSLFIG
jgi:hypothetical protein